MHLSLTPHSLVIDLCRSKTGQEAAEHTVGIPFGTDDANCPVRTLRSGLAVAGIMAGGVFRGVSRHGELSRRSLHKDCEGRIQERVARREGLNPGPLGGHSLRMGHAT